MLTLRSRYPALLRGADTCRAGASSGLPWSWDHVTEGCLPGPIWTFTRFHSQTGWRRIQHGRQVMRKPPRRRANLTGEQGQDLTCPVTSRRGPWKQTSGERVSPTSFSPGRQGIETSQTTSPQFSSTGPLTGDGQQTLGGLEAARLPRLFGTSSVRRKHPHLGRVRRTSKVTHLPSVPLASIDLLDATAGLPSSHTPMQGRKAAVSLPGEMTSDRNGPGRLVPAASDRNGQRRPPARPCSETDIETAPSQRAPTLQPRLQAAPPAAGAALLCHGCRFARRADAQEAATTSHMRHLPPAACRDGATTFQFASGLSAPARRAAGPLVFGLSPPPFFQLFLPTIPTRLAAALHRGLAIQESGGAGWVVSPPGGGCIAPWTRWRDGPRGKRSTESDSSDRCTHPSPPPPGPEQPLRPHALGVPVTAVRCEACRLDRRRRDPRALVGTAARLSLFEDLGPGLGSAVGIWEDRRDAPCNGQLPASLPACFAYSPATDRLRPCPGIAFLPPIGRCPSCCISPIPRPEHR
jgi:hypothetical protein